MSDQVGRLTEQDLRDFQEYLHRRIDGLQAEVATLRTQLAEAREAEATISANYDRTTAALRARLNLVIVERDREAAALREIAQYDHRTDKWGHAQVQELIDIARAALAETGNEAPLTGDKREDSTANARARIASLEGALREATEEIKRNRWVLGLVAEQQHKALEAIHIDLTDEEWAEFALALSGVASDALAEPAATECDGTCPKGRYCPEHGDLLPEELPVVPRLPGGIGTNAGIMNVEGVVEPNKPAPSTTPERCPTCQHEATTEGHCYSCSCAVPWHREMWRAGHTETST